MIFEPNISLEVLNSWGENTMTDFLDINFTKIGEDYLEATMPVNAKTKQPLGLLHGGANVVLAETLGSVAATLTIDTTKQYCVGLEINANHLKSVKEGSVTGITKPIHLGKKTQVWEVKIYTDQGDLSCISRITMAVIDKR
ncbi:hotdog fold thioesterase [Aquiflexum gelatinilyticum]|jgi:1,4-dihydroxy-2-naphthoyl-CoA hydrolase|uniref:Hotdog fold thioesterase n=1 Tax=Aquiflexum gelatinilyticum TaxID=2961943 RepID=A0A9X2P559_9BACT|nr:hotdog fold thioesterase [Aquiflexum gelatinilyticum]MCR9013722.1 hotdog fold thioesterase [Aquiflexum gelatinilyticum]MCS4433561.1 hotdog fold thioesterase [Aquiflexum gelatinilyticum]